ncbi:MAG: tautomerase family protein [Limnochordales bacterium]|nr:tautomerase family protein [Limnochordales bacterium]
MPFIEVLVYGRRLTPEEKSGLFHELNEEVKRILDTADGRVRIALHEGAAEDFFAGPQPAPQQDRI